jgi:class 3 adenylate cyclase
MQNAEPIAKFGSKRSSIRGDCADALASRTFKRLLEIEVAMIGENHQSSTREALAASPPQSLVRKGLSARHILEGRRRQATVLFTDMASFTPVAERLGEEKTYPFIQRVLQAMSEARNLLAMG